MDQYQAKRLPHQDAYPKPGGLVLMARVMGTVLSLVLSISIGIWAYKLVMRDVSGIPVIAASKNPMRIAPEDPGGTSAQNQGLSVNVVAEQGRVVDPDKVKLAPRPVILMTDDLTSRQLEEHANEMLSLSDLQIGSLNMTALADEIAEVHNFTETESIRLETLQVEDALREALESEIEFAPRFLGDLTVSLRPKERPTDVASLSVKTGAPAVRELAFEDIPKGTALVQLGAFDSDTVARREWMRLSKKFPGILSDRARVIQRTDRGGRTFYRLRASGFIDLNDARRFCSLLVAKNSDCIPVTVR